MFLVLAAATDPVAAAVTEQLRGDAVWWLSPHDLHRARWQHRIDDDGAVFTVSLDGRTVRSADVKAVLNRLRWLPPAAFAAPRDRDYAAFEWHALMLGVLHTVGDRVINPVNAPSLAGPRWPALQTLATLRGAGLAVRATAGTVDARTHARPQWQAQSWGQWLEPGAPAQASRGPVPPGRRPSVWVEPIDALRSCWVVDGEVLGEYRSGDPDLTRVSQVLGCPFLGVEVAEAQTGTVIAAVHPFPETVPPGVTAALVAWLRARS